ncbi:MAG: hypothetical protein ACPLYC_00585 [Minisyncoccia bacterium]
MRKMMILLVFVAILLGNIAMAEADNNINIKPDVVILDKLTPADFHYGFVEWNLPGPECRIGDKWQGKEKCYILTFIGVIDGLVYAAWVPVE